MSVSAALRPQGQTVMSCHSCEPVPSPLIEKHTSTVAILTDMYVDICTMWNSSEYAVLLYVVRSVLQA